jgi:nucleotide-binding universal stress UspA family protein
MTNSESSDVPLRVLVAVHGHEPAEWVTRACRVISKWKDARVRVLGVVDVPSPPFTSLIPPARRFYAAARSAWRDDEARRVQGAIDRVTRRLSRDVETVCRRSSPRGLVQTIADDALAWAADVIVVAAPTPGSASWLRPGPAHDRLLRHGTGAVLAIPAVPEPRRTGHVIRLPRAIPSGMQTAPARWRI